ncbi:hypothetical protein DAMA08_047990 [Martiniozyma asiatica (nom. inval.)]|nr:hypothetical protein DAMA08_047990 [Martiniozyma asiatica]
MSIPAINTPLRLPPPYYGTAVLRYIGSVGDKDGIFCGLELIGNISHRGKNSGVVDNVQYFSVEKPGSGLFVPLRRVRSWLESSASFDNVQLEPNDIVNKEPIVVTNRQSTSSNSNEIDVYKSRLAKSNNDLMELSAQLDELDAALKNSELKFSQREEKYAKYKIDKEAEIDQLIQTVSIVESKAKSSELEFKRIIEEMKRNMHSPSNELENLKIQLEATKGELEETRNSKIVNNEINTDGIDSLKRELEVEKKKFNDFKIQKNNEINDLRKVEMENFKLQMEIEKLLSVSTEQQNIDDVIKERDQLKIEIEDLTMDLKMKNERIESLLEDLNEMKSFQNRMNETTRDLEHKEKIIENYRDMEELVRKKEIEIGELQSKLQLQPQKNDIDIEIDIEKENWIDNSGSLKVFTPAVKIDPAAGRSNFCTYCDNDGHSTEECPYTNDNMDLF